MGSPICETFRKSDIVSCSYPLATPDIRSLTQSPPPPHPRLWIGVLLRPWPFRLLCPLEQALVVCWYMCRGWLLMGGVRLDVFCAAPPLPYPPFLCSDPWAASCPPSLARWSISPSYVASLRETGYGMFYLGAPQIPPCRLRWVTSHKWTVYPPQESSVS